MAGGRAATIKAGASFFLPPFQGLSCCKQMCYWKIGSEISRRVLLTFSSLFSFRSCADERYLSHPRFNYFCFVVAPFELLDQEMKKRYVYPYRDIFFLHGEPVRYTFWYEFVRILMPHESIW